MRRILTFFSILILCIANLHSADKMQLGVNLVSQGAFVNIINHTNRYQKVKSFDANGWPESDFELVIMDHRPVKEWSNDIDDPEVYRIDYSGVYHASFRGLADVSMKWSDAFIENKYYDDANNTSYFDLVIPGPPGKSHSFVYAVFSNTQRSAKSPLNTGITQLKIMRPGYSLDTKKIFTDEYINLCTAANFACYRFYTVQNIWEGEPDYPETTKWENRKSPTDATQMPMDNMNGKKDGWCWEYIIELANILNKDIWINMHISCDSAYVVHLAQMLKEKLNSNINIYVENSNEVWSPNFKKNGPYNKAQAEHYGISFNENYARRTVELSNLFASVFGKDAINKRIRIILAGQQAYSGRSDIHLNYINKTYGPPKNFIYATSTGLYFGSTKPSGTVSEINVGMLESIDAQISNPGNNSYRMNHINKAKNWELPGGCTSYEGGCAIPANGDTANLTNQILANRTEAMKDAIKKNYTDGWFKSGGGLALYFSLFSSYNRYGCWGITDDFNKPDRNYKMQAIREIIGDLSDADAENTAVFSGITVYPNPASKEFSIKIENVDEEKITVFLYNSIGELIKTVMANVLPNSNTVKINIENLSEGIYYLKIRTVREFAYKKIVVID